MRARKSVVMIALTLLFSSATLLETQPAFAHAEDSYSHDSAQQTYHSRWMSGLPNDTLLSQLSLPGTHDTLSYYGGDLLQTQTLSLVDQLNSGIRVLDIRCRHINDTFEIYHGPIDQMTSFDAGVLTPVIEFLDEHPTETVLMRVQEEYDSLNNTDTFAQTFEAYRAEYGVDWFWSPTTANPALADLRGKIVVLDNFSGGTPLTSYGLSWSALNIQDDYSLGSNWNLYSKWEKIKSQLNASNSAGDANDTETIYVNFLSGSDGSFPYFVASGHSDPRTDAPRLWTGLVDGISADTSTYPDFPRLDCLLGVCSVYFEGTNTLTSAYIDTAGLDHLGLVMSDFPGPLLIDTIVARNAL